MINHSISIFFLKNDKQKITYFILLVMSKSSAASDPLYHDVSPEYVRYTRLFLMFSGLICITSMICAVVKAQEEKKFYIITISLIVSIFFTICIFQFFKKRILLAEKLWFVNLTIFILFLQAIIYLIFVFMKPYPAQISTTTISTSTPFSTSRTTSNTTSNGTSTTVSSTSSTTKKYSWNKQIFLTKLYEQIDNM